MTQSLLQNTHLHRYFVLTAQWKRCMKLGSSGWDRRPVPASCQCACSRGCLQNTLTGVSLSLHTLYLHQDLCSGGVTRVVCE